MGLLLKYIKEREKEMKRLAKELDFEGAALIRDEINQLRITNYEKRKSKIKRRST